MSIQPNIDYIKKLSGDNSEFEQKFILILKEEFPVETQDYKNFIESRDLKMAAELVHKLKHKFNILSMTDAYTYAVAYEEELLANDMSGDVNFIAFLDTVKNYLNTL